MSRAPTKGGLSPEALFDTNEGAALDGASGGTEVFGGLVSQEAVLIVESGRHAGERVALGAGTCVIGRSSKCALVLRRSAGVSRRHSKVIYVGGTYEVSDCGSRNGTRVNGRKVGVGYPLNDGDVIQISDERIRFRGPSGRSDPDDPRGLLVDVEPVSRLPSREQPAGEIQRTQRVRVDSPDSLLMTKDGGTAPDRPIPPRKNPIIPPQRGARPAAPTAVFTSELDAIRRAQPPPVIAPPATMPPVPAEREPPKGALFALGIVLGVTVLVGGVAGWDLLLNDGRVMRAFEQDVGRLLAGDDGATAQAPQGPDAVEPMAEEPKVEEPSTEEPKVEEPKVEEPSTEEPKVEEPKAEEPSAEEPKAEEPAVTLVEVRAGVSGRVRSIAVSPGDVVRAGDTLLVIERPPSGGTARKLRALRREEDAFAKHAALGNARAKRDLEDVRREIARLERRTGTAEVKATEDGRVERLFVAVGGRVKSSAVVAQMRAR